MTEDEEYKQEHPERNVAVVGLRDAAGNVLLVRTHKLTQWWQPIGGGIDSEDKTPEAAAVREVQEELGITVDPNDLVLVLETAYDFGRGTVYFYEIQVDRNAVSLIIDEHEIIDHEWFSPKEAQEVNAFPATKAYLQTLIAG
jgi:8-oxo-dGTP pyrophosphatase MutT (NUDIX family)